MCKVVNLPDTNRVFVIGGAMDITCCNTTSELKEIVVNQNGVCETI